MRSLLLRMGQAGALTLLLVSVGCDAAEPLAAPAAPSYVVARDDAPTLLVGFFNEARGNGKSCNPLDVAAAPARRKAALHSAEWIDERGGQLSIKGLDENRAPIAHTLVVPEGVVSSNTLFCMSLNPTNHMRIDLTAYAVDSDGAIVNVGKAGFSKPVHLYLAYGAANVSAADAPRVRVVYVPEDRPIERTRSISLWQWGEYTYAELWHFSQYATALE